LSELIITRGLPGCGKTTWAEQWVRNDLTRRARVERDQLRKMLHFGEWRGRDTEDTIVMVETYMAADLLNRGISVVVSDTNLDEKTFGMWQRQAAGMHNVQFRVKDFRNVPLETCLERNAQRTGKEFIPKDVILRMYNQHIKHLPKPEAIDIQAERAKMTPEERFEYDYPDFEG